MVFRYRPVIRLVLAVILALSLVPVSGAAKHSKKKKKSAAAPEGTPILWRDPGDISTLDLYLGPGGDASKPDLSSVSLIRKETTGHSEKYRVRDGSGTVWVAKLGIEARPETAASRLVWAVGYFADINYFVPRLDVQGKGTLTDVRMGERPKSAKRTDENWPWDNNPFVGTKELQGLKVLMLLMENWDLKTSNNKVILVRNKETNENELRYVVTDLGSTFGRTGGAFSRDRDNPKAFARVKFIDKVEGNIVHFNYHGKEQSVVRDITVDQAVWIGDRLSLLSDQQISDAFRAANYSPEEITLLTDAVRRRITELVDLRTPATARY